MFDTAGPFCEITDLGKLPYSLAFMSSSVFRMLMGLLNPTLNFPPGYLQSVPFAYAEKDSQRISALALENIGAAKSDWNSYEEAWAFRRHPLV